MIYHVITKELLPDLLIRGTVDANVYLVIPVQIA